VRGEQLMADRPKERLMSGDPPFTNVGVDYFGPFYVRQGRSNVNAMDAYLLAWLSGLFI